jgi:hypothetical protein
MLAIAGMTACGGAEDAEEHPAPPPVEETVFGDMVGTMDEARAVQDTTMKHKQDLDRALQESEGN